MRDLELSDVDFIIRSLQQMRTESPVYGECADDPEYVASTLRNLILCDVMYGVVAPGKGFLLYTMQPTWFCADVYANEQLMYVHPDYRGGSTAFKLILSFVNAAEDAKCKYCAAGASSGINDERVLKLYQRIGFKPWKHGVRLQIG